ncbi:MAG: aspartate kinase [Desulfobacterales bacterium]|nr:aspartate kinase [Desulfobacterales bacterium]
MKVIKIGGGCLKDGPAANVIIDLITRRGKGDIFVLSAFYGVTDILISGIDLALSDEENIPDIISRLKGLHHTIIKELINDNTVKKQLSKSLGDIYAKLERYYYGISFTREATARMQDMIATFGERISAVILSKAVAARGGDSQYVLPEDLGMISDGKFMDASALMEKTGENIQAWLGRHMTPEKILFVPGFYGISESGEITTFGRGGSDYSAAVVAAGSGADALEIWKDTEGFMTADPDNIPHCRLIPKLTYEEAAELAYTGAGILHPRTVEPVKNAGIDIAIKNTYNPDAPGSLITREVPRAENIIKSVSYTTDVAILKIYAPGVGARFGFLSSILAPLGRAGINVKSVVTSQTCISLILSRKDIHAGHEAVQAIRPVPFRKAVVVTDVALVSIVGEGLHTNRGIAAKCFSAVSGADVNIEMISSGTSNAALYFLVKEKRLDDTIQALHKIFFDS